MYKMIAATSQNGVIGSDNTIPWHCPEDLKFFKEKTMNQTLLMGRKTFESLPHILKNRDIYVLTRDSEYPIPKEKILTSVDDAIKILPEDTIIAGGAQIYEMFLPHVDIIYLSRIPVVVDGDAYFPELNETQWRKTIVNKETFILEVLERI